MVFLYNNTKPEISDIVLAKITEINKFNIVACLIDYDNLVGYVSYSELAKKRRYKLNKIVHVGKEVVVQVTGFNTTKNFAELSIRAVNETDVEKFNKSRRNSLNLYNLWRYVYMKLNPELNMDINKINSDDMNDFMNKTFWKIKEKLEEQLQDSDTEDSDNINKYYLDELYNVLLDHLKNDKLIIYVEDYDKILIKNILDNYALTKIVPIKHIKHQEFNIQSYDLEGLADIKKSLDYKSFDKYSELIEKYDIIILYLSGGKYSMTIKEKTTIDEDITNVFDYFIQEIKSRCESNNVLFNLIVV